MNADAAPFVPIPERVKAVIRYVMTPSSNKFIPSALVWKTVKGKPLIVYRGQCSYSVKAIPRVGNNPLEISLQYGKLISTSTSITPKIKAFACEPPYGRMFEIHVVPGVLVAELRDSVSGYTVNEAAFQFLKDELPDTSGWKNSTLAQLRAAFFRTLSEENEVLIDPSKGRFLKESGEQEDWKSREVDGKYVTGFFPNKGGRRRTLRSNLKKRTRRRSKWRQTSS
jgi:hypothetical protein